MRMTIKKQLVMALLLVGLAPFIIMGITSYVKSSGALSLEANAKMNMARDLKKSELLTYLGMLKNSIENMSENRQIRAALDELVQLSKKHKVNADSSFAIINEPEVKSVYATFDGYFNAYMKKKRSL